MIGDTVLYFGCRHKSQDYIYEEELAGYEEEGTVSDLQVAFSRDQVCAFQVTVTMCGILEVCVLHCCVCVGGGGGGASVETNPTVPCDVIVS